MLTPEAYDSRFMRPATLCRCGHILDCCADCMGWMLEHSPRIASAWEWWYIKTVELGVGMGQEWGSDAAEAECHDFYHHALRGDQ